MWWNGGRQRHYKALSSGKKCVTGGISMKMKSQRLDWIDGLRLLASFFIFADHYFLYFLPGSYYGRRVAGTEFAYALSQSPVSVWINGNFWVCVFCIVSGLVASLKVFRNQNKPHGLQAIGDAAVNRYLRLVLPCFGMSILVYAMLRLDLMKNHVFTCYYPSEWADILYYQYDPKSNVLTLLLDSFIRVPFSGSEKYSIALWTIPFLLFGYLFSLLLAQMSVGQSPRILLVYGLFAFGLLFTGREIEACFPIGTAMAYHCNYRKEATGRSASLFGAVLILLGLFFGGYPTEVIPTNVYAYLNFAGSRIPPFMLWHLLGSALLMLGLVYCRPVRHFLGLHVLAEMGKKLSFSMYLVHIILLTSVSSAFAVALIRRGMEYMTIFWLLFPVTLALLLPASWLFNRCIVEPSGWMIAAANRYLQNGRHFPDELEKEETQ